MNVGYKIENKDITLSLEGKTFVGSDEVLLNQDVNILTDLDWEEKGYKVDSFLKPSDFNLIQEVLKERIGKLIIEAGGKIDDDFTLENYHNYVTDEIHLEIAKIIQPGWNVSTFPVDFQLINNRVSEIVEKKVDSAAVHIGINHFFLRIVRPQKFQDNNPPHRDVWLDRLRNAINIYVPIVGSDKNSSLPLIPGSHLAKESEIERTKDGAFLNNTQYSVPCVISYKGIKPDLIRPATSENEIMVFSPYLVHGGGYNFNENKTRVSLEVRFWKPK